MRPTTSRPVTSRIGNTANANIAARLGPVRVPVRAPFVGNGRPGAANVPRVLGPRGTNVNNAENAQNAQNPPVRQPVRQPEQDQRTTLTGAGTWEYQSPAFDPEGEVSRKIVSGKFHNYGIFHKNTQNRSSFFTEVAVFYRMLYRSLDLSSCLVSAVSLLIF